jgi:hypothetical protein
MEPQLWYTLVQFVFKLRLGGIKMRTFFKTLGWVFVLLAIAMPCVAQRANQTYHVTFLIDEQQWVPVGKMVIIPNPETPAFCLPTKEADVAEFCARMYPPIVTSEGNYTTLVTDNSNGTDYVVSNPAYI